MAKGDIVGGFLGNKWVRISIYSVLVLLILWVLYVLAKKFITAIARPSAEENQQIQLENITTDNNEYPSTPMTESEAMQIADGAEGAMSGMGTSAMSLFEAIIPWQEDPNALRMIYQAFGTRDGQNLFQWYQGDLADICTNGCWAGFSLYLCDIPVNPCGCDYLDKTELGCMRYLWRNSGLGGM
jgi:hypothetical protein